MSNTSPGSSASVWVRPDVLALPQYVPGARGSAAAPIAHKLSSNENPYPPLPGVLAAVADAAADINRYPDLIASEVAAAIGDRFAVPAAGVVVGNGSVAVLQHVLSAVAGAGDEVVYAWRSFEAYPIAVGIAGATSVQVPLTAAARHDLPAMAAAVTARTRAVVVCSPNNPTGTAVRHDEMQALLSAVPRDVLVVLDEAYVEFVTDPQAARGLELLAKNPNLVLLRTFSKAYGLAGLRVGYSLSEPALAAAIRSVSTPFGVSGVAQYAALASLEAAAELERRVADLAAERERVVAKLAEQGWRIPQAQGNFVWLELGDDAVHFAKAAAAGGVLVRPFAGDGVRVTVGDAASNDAFLGIAAAYTRQK